MVDRPSARGLGLDHLIVGTALGFSRLRRQRRGIDNPVPSARRDGLLFHRRDEDLLVVQEVVFHALFAVGGAEVVGADPDAFFFGKGE